MHTTMGTGTFSLIISLKVFVLEIIYNKESKQIKVPISLTCSELDGKIQ